MYESWFTYPITRPWPFRWFTPVTIASGIILTVIFSLINLASSGFYLKPIYTNDPNGTIASHSSWYMKAPFNWEEDIQTICQPNVLSVGDSFFSTTLGLQYKVKSISRKPDGSKRMASLPSIPYLNNTLENCLLKQVSLNLHRADNRAGDSWWISWINSNVAATASCTVVSGVGPVTLTLDVGYSGQVDAIYDYVINDNYTTHASVWWGTRLLNVYWAGVLASMSHTTPDDSSYYTDGILQYTRNKDQDDIRAMDFFDLDYWWVLTSDSFIENNNNFNVSGSLYNNPKFFLSSVATGGFYHATLLQSLVAVDLGSCDSPNLLLDRKSLEYAILPPEDMNRKPGGALNGPDMGSAIQFSNISYPGTPYSSYMDPDLTVFLNESYKEFHPLMGDLKCKNATVVSQYLCSVPQKKSIGNMAVAIILADLVFLQAAWTILNWISGRILSQAGTPANFCEGCLGALSQRIEMESLTKFRQLEEVNGPVRSRDQSTERLLNR